MNHFYGNIPEEALKGDVLQILILHYNEFEGPLPRTLLNCTALQVLDVGNNGLNDSFPDWLDALPQLAVLILSSNHFHGVIGNPTAKIPFPMLRVLDLSNNHFTGHLPENYLLHFTGIINDITPDLDVTYSSDHFVYVHGSSVMLVVKGSVYTVEEILNLYTLIDLSSNMFDGDIPISIGILGVLRHLNLSHNRLTGHIPSSLGNLTLLEALDMSCNQLTGEIPWQLSKLGFLEVLNVSYNHLLGAIPRSRQLDTIANDSYLGNTALCGFPLTLECEASRKPHVPSQEEEEEEDSGFFNGFSWQSVTIGYCCSFPFGVCVGYFGLRYGKLNWLLRKLTWKRGKGSKNTVPRRDARRRTH
ncbi:PREDICTED: receptor-like protein 12 [Ipomoea nil]|uniref:receptor-like protein 12 n=1 Tax=Ipomoea nil TaxID=35883 RepID=UPI0009019BE4|nr:PREDICTED: receptor-like protein 12 [Ipomoea nil]XP_019161736.1 PREDICTED: receptor-like protein 12 [Ipomoea nil]